MFNTTIHKTETTVTPVTRVVEKSITPDKVTDMYDKVRAEVEKSIVQTVRVESNSLNGVAMQMEARYDTLQTVVYTQFTLNGKVYIDSTFASTAAGKMLSKETLFRKLAEHVSSVVTRDLMKEAGKILFSKS